jgi:hypothetical protein
LQSLRVKESKLKRFSLPPALTVAGVVIPFVIAVLLYNSTKERNEEILEVQTTVSNSDAILEIQIRQDAMDLAIADLSAQISKTQSDYGQLLLAVESLSSDRRPNRELTRRLGSILDQLEAQDEKINELRQRVASANTGPEEIEAIVVETIERLLRTIGD